MKYNFIPFKIMIVYIINIIQKYSASAIDMNTQYHNTYTYDTYGCYNNESYKLYNYRNTHIDSCIVNNKFTRICPLPKEYTIP